MQDWQDMWPDNYVHPTAVIDSSVRMGTGNYIGPYTVIGELVVLGNGNRIESHSSIGSPAEHKGFFSGRDSRGVNIGDNNTIREFTTINSGTTRPTIIGSSCIMLRGSHHSHDSVMEDGVTLSCNVLIGGHSHIMEGAVLGLGATIHQYQIIGAYSMLGMGAIVPKHTNILPCHKYVGNPAKSIGLNEIGMERNFITKGQQLVFDDAFWKLKEAK